MIYKPPRVAHTVASLILILRFPVEGLYGVSNTLNIFLFPELSLSAVFKASMVDRMWDIYLDRNTLSAYADTLSFLQ